MSQPIIAAPIKLQTRMLPPPKLMRARSPVWVGAAGADLNTRITNSAERAAKAAMGRKALRQPQRDAIHTSITGASTPPMTVVPSPCTTPIRRPRRADEPSGAANDCIKGNIGPLTMPVQMRARNSATNVVAKPAPRFAAASPISSTASNARCVTPRENAKIPTPDRAHASEYIAASMPMLRFCRLRSATMNGLR